MTGDKTHTHKPKRKRLGVLISGRGSNLQALIDAIDKDPDFPAEIALVISNIAGVQGLKRAEKAGLQTTTINHRSYEDRESFERAIDGALRQARVDLVCLAGFMRLLTPWFIKSWPDRIMNIHPSLLPSFKGLNTHARALAAGVRFTGCTVHFVRPEMDAGPIIVQASVPVQPGDDENTLAARVLAAEHIAYPTAIRLVAGERVRIIDERVEIDPGAITSSTAETQINPMG